MEEVVGRVKARRAAGVDVRGGPAGELVHREARVLGVVLPVPVAAADEDVVVGVVRVYPAADLVSLGLEGGVRVVVALRGAVGPDDGRGAHEHAPVGVAGEDGVLPPLLLDGAPDGLVRAVGGVVGAPIVAPLDEPDLERLPPAERPVGEAAHRDLLAEDDEPLVESQAPVRLPRPAVILERVVVVLLPVARHLEVEAQVLRQAVHPVPLPARERRGVGQGGDLVVVDRVARRDDEVRGKRKHRIVDLVALLGDVQMFVLLARDNGELHVRVLVSAGCRPEGTRERAVHGRSTGAGGLGREVVGALGQEPGHLELVRVVRRRADVDPVGRHRPRQVGREAVAHADLPRSAGARPVGHLAQLVLREPHPDDGRGVGHLADLDTRAKPRLLAEGVIREGSHNRKKNKKNQQRH